MGYSLGEAAKAVGRTKPTILRAIRSGKISAKKDEASGAWDIDPSELHRIYDPVSQEERVTERETVQSNNELQIEVKLLRERLADKDAMIEELREDRDQWRDQAQRLALTDQRANPADVLVTPPPAAISGDGQQNAPPTPAPLKRRWRLFGGRE